MPEIDVMGADDILGAMFNQIARSNPALARRVAAAGPRNGQSVSRPSAPALPGGTASVNTLRSFMGMSALNGSTIGGAATWDGTDGADKTLQAEPQESFEGKRLIIDSARSDGAAASLISVKSLFIGSQPQSPVVDSPAPISMFGPDATGADLDLQIAYRANKVTLSLAITAAPGAGETVAATAGLYGNWIR